MFSFYNLYIVLVALLATVIIWLQDFNSQGVLNMTPLEREELAKFSVVPISINDDDARGNDESDNGAGHRNKYLNRIGVGETGNSSDTEPLLQ